MDFEASSDSSFEQIKSKEGEQKSASDHNLVAENLI